jgi:outer membrane protein assembly factor BamB
MNRMRAPLLAAIATAFAWNTAFAAPGLEWQHAYDGGSRQADTGVTALTDPAGNPVIAGEITDVAGNGNLLIRKLDRNTGAPIWSREILGTADNRLAVSGMVWDGFGHLLIGGTRLGCYG